MKPLIPPSLFSSRKREQQSAAALSGETRFDPLDIPEQRPGAAARLIAERFLGEIQLEWARSKPRIRDLWQPPGE